jgi:hypothetical protein
VRLGHTVMRWPVCTSPNAIMAMSFAGSRSQGGEPAVVEDTDLQGLRRRPHSGSCQVLAVRQHIERQQVRKASFQGQPGADFQDALAGMMCEAGGGVPDSVAERIRVGFPQVLVIAEAEEPRPGR